MSTLGRRSRRWSLRWLPIALLAGIGTALFLRWYVGYQGWSGTGPRGELWIWINFDRGRRRRRARGWRNSRGWQRGGSVLAIPLCMLSAALAVNHWVGYVPTATAAWDLLTGAPLGGQIDANAFRAMRDKGEADQQDRHGGEDPRRRVRIRAPRRTGVPAPAWYAITTTRAAGCDDDRRRVRSSRGLAQRWRTEGTRRFPRRPMVATPRRRGWTRAVVRQRHRMRQRCSRECRRSPDQGRRSLHGSRISESAPTPRTGDSGMVRRRYVCAGVDREVPRAVQCIRRYRRSGGANAGTRQQTLQRLFGGDAQTWAAFDPKTVMGEHGTYRGSPHGSSVSEPATAVYRAGRLIPVTFRYPGTQAHSQRRTRRGGAIPVRAEQQSRHRMRSRTTAWEARFSLCGQYLRICSSVAGRKTPDTQRAVISTAGRRRRSPGMASPTGWTIASLEAECLQVPLNTVPRLGFGRSSCSCRR